MKKIGRIFAGISAILFCGGLSTFFSHGISLLNTPKTAEISGVSQPGGGGAEPLIDPGSGSNPQNDFPTDANLPSEYIQLNFVQSTGKQYVDTGVIPSPTIKIDIDFALMGITNSYWDYVLYGGDGAHSNCVGLLMDGQTKISTLYGPNRFSVNFVMGERYRIHMENNSLVLDDTTTVSGTYRNFVGANYPIYVFGANSSGSFWRGTHTRIYKLKIYDGDELLRDFVPCYNKTAAEYGLYDAANQVFYGNAAGDGSGKLLGSSFVEESEDCKFLDYEQYFIDKDMTNNISTTTITGTGETDNPYVINSSEDFWWASKFQSWENKYVELGSNIALNEEKFDQDGNATGGDGIVYLWQPQSKWGYIEGNEHVVSGYCIKNFTNSRAGLVDTVVSIENCYFDNFYCYSSSGLCVGICVYVTTIKNVHTLGGFVERGDHYAGGMAYVVQSCARNCSNNAMVKANGYVAGLFISAQNAIIENCVNYANLEVKATSVGGIVMELTSTSTIRNCVNYGNLIAGRYHLGGMAAEASGTIIGCVNYGSFGKSTNGGIVAVAKGCLDIISCKNFGSTSASMIGFLAMTNKNKANIINIIDCYAECSQDASIVGSVYTGTTPNNTVINIKDYHCVIPKNTVLMSDNRNLVLVGSLPITVNMENVFIECHAEKLNLTICWAGDGMVTNVKNLYIKAYSSQVEMRKLIREMPNSKTRVQGIIVENNYAGKSVKDYYGSDFSGFNISWRTGEISLNALSSAGSFSARLTEENLLGMGFQKKVI